MLGATEWSLGCPRFRPLKPGSSPTYSTKSILNSGVPRPEYGAVSDVGCDRMVARVPQVSPSETWVLSDLLHEVDAQQRSAAARVRRRFRCWVRPNGRSGAPGFAL